MKPVHFLTTYFLTFVQCINYSIVYIFYTYDSQVLLYVRKAQNLALNIKNIKIFSDKNLQV